MGAKNSIFRKTLVVFQFSLSIFLIVGTIVIYNQLIYMQNKNLGYNKEHVLYFSSRGELAKSYETIKNEFLKSQGVLDVSGSNHRPSQIGSNSGGADWEGKDPELKVLICMMWVDKNYFDVMGISFAGGQTFSDRFENYSLDAVENVDVILNEEAIRRMKMEDPVSKYIGRGDTKGTIVGVANAVYGRAMARPSGRPSLALAGQQTQQPVRQIVEVVQAFAQAPVPNPDGSTGISLHLLISPTPLPDFVEHLGDLLFSNHFGDLGLDNGLGHFELGDRLSDLELGNGLGDFLVRDGLGDLLFSNHFGDLGLDDGFGDLLSGNLLGHFSLDDRFDDLRLCDGFDGLNSCDGFGDLGCSLRFDQFVDLSFGCLELRGGVGGRGRGAFATPGLDETLAALLAVTSLGDAFATASLDETFAAGFTRSGFGA